MRRHLSRREQEAALRQAAETAELTEWFTGQERAENPPDGDQRFAAIAAWGETLADVQRVISEVARSLGIEMQLEVRFVEDMGDAGPFPLARCHPVERLVEINAPKWQASAPWRRLEHAAHELGRTFRHGHPTKT